MLIVFEDIILERMIIPSMALSRIIFESIETAYLEKDTTDLDRVTEIVKRMINDFDFKKEIKYSRRQVYRELAWRCRTKENLARVFYDDFKIDLTDEMFKDFTSKVLPLYWYLSLKFVKHDFDINFKGLYQKYFIEGKGKHLRKKIKMQ